MVFSIWSKMQRHVPFEGVYDIFAIRIIIDCPHEEEKRLCWTVYSVVTDFYTPNPNRMRDGSVPPVERLRVAAHHRVGRRPPGRVQVTPSAWTPCFRKREHRRALALQGRGTGSADQRTVARPPARTDGGHDALAGAAFRRQTRLGRDLRLHPQRRPAQAARRGHAARLRLRHPHQSGLDLLGRQGEQPRRVDPRTAAQRRHRGDPDAEEPDAQGRLARVRRHGEGAQQDQELPARGAGQTYAHGARGAGTQTQELETPADDRRGGGLPRPPLQGAHGHGGLRPDRHAEARLRDDQGLCSRHLEAEAEGDGAPRRPRSNARRPRSRARRSRPPPRRTRW